MNWRSAWILACLGGCGPKYPDLLLGINTRTSQPSTVVLGEQADRLSVSSVWLRLGDIAITGDCGTIPVETVWPGLGLVDHADAAAVKQTLETGVETACLVETSLVADPEATDDPGDLAGASVALLGNLPDGRAYEIYVRETIPLSFTLEREEIPEPGSWLISFDVAAWLDEASISAVSGFPIVSDAETNPAILSGMMARLPYGIQMHLDANDDGQVAVDERRIDVPPAP